MANVKIISYKDKIEKNLEKQLTDNMNKVGALVERQAKNNVSQIPPNHPQVQTGRLRSSIIHWQSRDNNKITESIGSNVKYSKFLELGTVNHPPYPWLIPAVDQSKEKIEKILGNKFTTQGDISNLD